MAGRDHLRLDALDASLEAARVARATLPAFSAGPDGFTIDEGYELGARRFARRVHSGWTRSGLKIGFTNQRRWKELGLDQPIWAPIYRQTVHERSALAVEEFVQPRIEPEIVFGFESPLATGAGAAAIARAIAWVAPAFEIVECHFADWAIRPADAIADAGLHAALMVGRRTSISSETAGALPGVKVTLMKDGHVVAQGSGSDVLGGPVLAVAWLLQALPAGETIRVGDVVTTGTLTEALPIARGERWTMRLEGAPGIPEHEILLRGAD